MNDIKGVTTADIARVFFGIDLKHGKQYCPLPGHTGKSASFNYNSTKDLWFCHSEKIGGDGLEFYRWMTGKGMGSCFADIKDRFGLDDSSLEQKGYYTKEPEMNLYIKFCEQVMQLAAENLTGKNHILNFAFEKWGFTKEILQKYSVGYMDYSLYSKLESLFGTAKLEEFGFIGNTKTGGKWKVFQDRVIFPYFNWSRRPIYFIGREVK